MFQAKQQHILMRQAAIWVVNVLFTFTLLCPRHVLAQTWAPVLSPQMLLPSQPVIPVLLKGMVFDPNKPLAFQFIVDSGDRDLTEEQARAQALPLIKYFMAALTVPKDDLWVNLSPYEEDRIIPEALGKTDLGRGLLEQDYILKQFTSSLLHPDQPTGKVFWQRVYQIARERFGTNDIPMGTFHKVWILPERVVVYEEGLRVEIVETKLKVMMEADYAALNDSVLKGAPSNLTSTEEGDISSELMKEMILPVIEQEVNEGAHFAPLRQMFYSLILAKWYKETLQTSFLHQVYVDQNKVEGVDIEDAAVAEKVYARYRQAYQQGAFDFIKEEYDDAAQTVIPRKYFAGGVIGDGNVQIQTAQEPKLFSGQRFHVDTTLIKFGFAPEGPETGGLKNAIRWGAQSGESGKVDSRLLPFLIGGGAIAWLFLILFSTYAPVIGPGVQRTPVAVEPDQFDETPPLTTNQVTRTDVIGQEPTDPSVQGQPDPVSLDLMQQRIQKYLKDLRETDSSVRVKAALYLMAEMIPGAYSVDDPALDGWVENTAAMVLAGIELYSKVQSDPSQANRDLLQDLRKELRGYFIAQFGSQDRWPRGLSDLEDYLHTSIAGQDGRPYLILSTLLPIIQDFRRQGWLIKELGKHYKLDQDHYANDFRDIAKEFLLSFRGGKKLTQDDIDVFESLVDVLSSQTGRFTEFLEGFKDVFRDPLVPVAVKQDLVKSLARKPNPYQGKSNLTPHDLSLEGVDEDLQTLYLIGKALGGDSEAKRSVEEMLGEGGQTAEDILLYNRVLEFWDLEKKGWGVSDESMSEKNTGGIDFNRMEFKRQGSGISLDAQDIDRPQILNSRINGFFPVITNIQLIRH